MYIQGLLSSYCVYIRTFQTYKFQYFLRSSSYIYSFSPIAKKNGSNFGLILILLTHFISSFSTFIFWNGILFVCTFYLRTRLIHKKIHFKCTFQYLCEVYIQSIQRLNQILHPSLWRTQMSCGERRLLTLYPESNSLI